MKNNLFLAIAIVMMSVAGLTSCQTPATQEAGNTTAQSSEKQLKVAVINNDSLFVYYKYYEATMKDLNTKREKAQKQLQTRASKLQNEMISAEKRARAGLMSKNDMQRTQQDLAQKQQDLQVYEQTLTAGLVEEEQVKNQELLDQIKEYIEEYNQEKGYDLIINYVQGGTVWYASEAIDITKDIVDGLNAKFQAKETSTDTTDEAK